MNKPKVKLIGVDGNAFVVMAQCLRAAKQAGWTKEQTDKMIEEMMSGDYDHLLTVVAERFEVN